MQSKLDQLVEQIRGYEMSPDEVAEQRVSFAYGNASRANNSSKEQVRKAVNSAEAPAIAQ